MARNVYVVEADGLPARLIEASQSTQALAYAARTTYAVRKASQQDLIRLLPAGIQVEKAVPEPGLFDPEPEVKIDSSGNVVALVA